MIDCAAWPLGSIPSHPHAQSSSILSPPQLGSQADPRGAPRAGPHARPHSLVTVLTDGSGGKPKGGALDVQIGTGAIEAGACIVHSMCMQEPEVVISWWSLVVVIIGGSAL